MAEGTVTPGINPDGSSSPDAGSNPQHGTRRARKKRGVTIIVDPNVPDPPKAERVSGATIKKVPISQNAAATQRATRRLQDGKSGEGRTNPGYTPPEPLPFESTLAFAFRSSGGTATAINGARLVEDPRFEKVVWAYDHASAKDKDLISLETLCAAAEIPADEFLGKVISALWQRSIEIGKLTAIAAHPRIVEATIRAAEGQWGDADRRFLLDHAGFLPKPVGQTINVGVDARSVTTTEINVGKGLPSFEEEGKKLNTAMRKEMRALEAGAEPITISTKEAIPVEAEFVDVPSKSNSN